MLLFQSTILKNYLNVQDISLIQSKWELFKNHFHNPTVQKKMRNSKEEQYQEGFLIAQFLKELKREKVTLSLIRETEREDYFFTEQKKTVTLKVEIEKIENVIDQMVCKLYGLTEKEIKIVENI